MQMALANRSHGLGPLPAVSTDTTTMKWEGRCYFASASFISEKAVPSRQMTLMITVSLRTKVKRLGYKRLDVRHVPQA